MTWRRPGNGRHGRRRHGIFQEWRRHQVKVTIEPRDNCTSCALCWSDCPDIFEEDPKDGFSRIVEKLRVGADVARGEVPESLRPGAQAAADGCPVSIIHVK
jgi:ferredoxin